MVRFAYGQLMNLPLLIRCTPTKIQSPLVRKHLMYSAKVNTKYHKTLNNVNNQKQAPTIKLSPQSNVISLKMTSQKQCLTNPTPFIWAPPDGSWMFLITRRCYAILHWIWNLFFLFLHAPGLQQPVHIQNWCNWEQRHWP